MLADIEVSFAILDVRVLCFSAINCTYSRLYSVQCFNIICFLSHHFCTFIAAGHETTAITLAWTLYLLSQYPQVCIKLQDEIALCWLVANQLSMTSQRFLTLIGFWTNRCGFTARIGAPGMQERASAVIWTLAVVTPYLQASRV